MKKLTALFVCIVMIAATFAVSASAAGEILWYEDFSDKFTNPNNWILEGNEFFCDDFTDASNPCIVAYDAGVVCQMEYSSESPNPRKYANFSMMSKIQVRDFDADGDHKVGFWWRDDFYENADELGVELGEIYNVMVNMDTMTIDLTVEGEENPRATAPVSGLEVGGDWFTLGWRIVPGKISCFVNNQKLIDYASADIGATQQSPILLLNNNCYSAWDDVVVATADYNLFNESDVAPAPGTSDNGTTANQGGNATQAPEATTSKKVVEVTDEQGNAVTDASGNKVTEEIIVTDAPVADTNTGAVQGGNSTTTGDVSFVVICVMVATLGCAVIVKKVNVK